MTVALGALGALGLSAIDLLAPGAPRRSIGGLIAQITEEELAVDTLTISEHPVEQGANISDNAYKDPAQVTIRVGWSDSSLAALGGAITAAVNATNIGGVLSAFTAPTYAAQVYAQLLSLQVSRSPLIIVTGKRTYKNMLIRSLSQATDTETENALKVTVICREVILVQTQTTIVPSPSVMQNPQSTASPTSQGQFQPKPAATVFNRGAYLPGQGPDTGGGIFEMPVNNDPLRFQSPTERLPGGPL